MEDVDESLYDVALNRIDKYLNDERISSNEMLKNYYKIMKHNLISFMKELEKLDVPLKLDEISLNDDVLLSGGRYNITNYFIIFVKILLVSLLLIIMIVLIVKLISKIYYQNERAANYV